MVQFYIFAASAGQSAACKNQIPIILHKEVGDTIQYFNNAHLLTGCSV